MRATSRSVSRDERAKNRHQKNSNMDGSNDQVQCNGIEYESPRGCTHTRGNTHYTQIDISKMATKDEFNGLKKLMDKMCEFLYNGKDKMNGE